jgi:hypothetical protein
MDKKEKQMIEYYYNKFSTNIFDEKDVFAFLILVRYQAKDIRCLRELGDFIAHRDKDKGFIKTYLEKTKEILDNLGKVNAILKIEPVFSFKEIKNGINRILLNNGFGKLTDETINHIILCIISILQDVKLTEKNKEIGKLFFGISSKRIELMGQIQIVQDGVEKAKAVFPALSTKNIYYEMKKQDEYDTPYLFEDKIVEVINHEEKFLIITR